MSSQATNQDSSIPVNATAIPTVHVTESAVKKVYALMKEEGDFKLMLRVYIEGGGCSGFQYGFTFDDCQQPDDFIVTKKVEDEEDKDGQGTDEIKLAIDPMSFQYLVGAEIDYKDDLEGARFIIRNPNATTTCGCGSSFSV